MLYWSKKYIHGLPILSAFKINETEIPNKEWGKKLHVLVRYYQTSRLVDLPDKDRTVLLFQICKAFPTLYH